MKPCRLCGGRIDVKYKNYIQSGDFVVHLNCGLSKKSGKKPKKGEKITKKAQAFIAPRTVRGWRDIK